MIVFRTSASAEAGYRRLQRCIYLGAALRGDVDILFCVDKDKQTLELLSERKFRVCLTSEYDLIHTENPRAIVFDLQGFSKHDSDLLQWATANGCRTVQFAEWSQRRAPVDVTIDCTATDIPPDAGNLLAGPEFAALHHKYRHFNKTRRKYRSSIRNIVVDLGETIEYRLFRDMVDIVTRQVKHVKIVPGYVLKKGNKKTLKRIYPNISFAGKAESFARAYFEADIALVPPGIEAFQAAAAGTPALYLTGQAEGEPCGRELERRHLGYFLGTAQEMSRKGFKELLDRLDFFERLEIGGTGREMVDGRGSDRIIDFLKKNVII